MAQIIPSPHDVIFDPEVTYLMGAAFDEACRVYGEQPSPVVKKRMAYQIVAKASEGERNRRRLTEAAIKAGWSAKVDALVS
jgi:hypothetical protein